MSQQDELQPPERIDPTPPGDNDQKVNNRRKVKEEGVKKENEVTRKLSEISAPKRRKVLDKMMKKYHRDPFYQPIDIVKKILKKLRVSNTQYFMGRIRQDMEKWIEENNPNSNENNDSKKKVLAEAKEKKQNVLAAINEEKAKEKTNPETVTEQVCPAEAMKKVQQSETEPMHPVIDKEIPVIDLTVELKKEIKTEIITIDEDSSSASNAKEANSTTTNTPGALPVIPYPMIGYNPNSFYYPDGFYPYPNPYHGSMYDPFMYQYNYQYPYNPYFYDPPCNSDFLPNFPVDHSSTQDPNLANRTEDASLPKDADKSLDTDAGKTDDAGELNKKKDG